MSHRAFADLIDYEEFWDDARQVDPGAVGRRIPRFQLPDPMQGDPTAWFLGPRGENFELFAQLILDAMSSNKTFRLDFHPEDATVITESMKARAEYRAGVDSIRQALNELLSDLRDHTTPYYSWRYQGHMLWDTTIPSLVGYFATMLHNPNNVTVQASPLTTLLEQQVGWDLCAMLGFPFGTSVPDPHGHLTSGGTVANIEATWSARELRYLPLVVRDLLTEPASGPLYWLEKKEAVTASYMGEEKSIVDLSEWELLNLSQDDVLDLPRQILCLGPPRVPGDRSQPRWTERAVWELLLKNSVNWLGLLAFHHRYLVGDDVPPIGPPVVFTPASKHYSWPKAMALLGGGSGPSSVMDIKVDRSGRMDIEDLERNLNRARAAWRPTLLVVGVAGSTEESSVDDIGAILDMRCRFRQEGYEFNVHIDAAWGGYFLSSIRKDFDDPGRHDKLGLDKFFDPAAWSYRLDKEAGRFEVHDLPGSGRAELGNDCSPDRLDTERKEAPKPVDEMTEGRDKPAYPVFLSQYVVDAFRMIADADSATVDPHKTGYTPYPAGAICYRNGNMRRLVTYGAPVIGTGQNATSVGEYGIEGSKPGAAAASVYVSHAVIRPSHTGHGRLTNASLLNAKLFWLGLVGLNKGNGDFIAVPLADPMDFFPQRVQGTGETPLWFEDHTDPEFLAILNKLDALEEKLQQHNPEDMDVDELRLDQSTGARKVGYDSVYRTARELGPDLNIVDFMFNFRRSNGEVNKNLRLLNRFNLAIYDRLHVATSDFEGTRVMPDRSVGSISHLPVIISKTDVWRSTYGDEFVLSFLERLGVVETGPGEEEVRNILETVPADPCSSGPDDPRTRESGEDWLDCFRKIALLRSVIMDPFLHTEDLRGDFFVHRWMKIVEDVVLDVVQGFRNADPDGPEGCAD